MDTNVFKQNNNYASENKFQYSCYDHLIRDMKTKTDIYDQVNSILYNTQLFEAFMGNTLQTVLQLYILACNGFVASSWLQWWSVGSSLASVSWITVNHYCSQHPNEYIRFFKVKLGIRLPRYLFMTTFTYVGHDPLCFCVSLVVICLCRRS